MTVEDPSAESDASRRNLKGISETSRVRSNAEEYANRRFIVKISGVWETYEDIGLTYKLIEVSPDLKGRDL